ncbi:MAG: hypothetical protein MUO99_08480, partial [Dehalococcoidales bacterium]|nr:hypothetical protein [Dehalococcoidales bacterium]
VGGAAVVFNGDGSGHYFIVSFTFTDAMIADLDYIVDDEDIWNDILLIEGAVGSEELVRGYSATSIQKYARRSRRIERPLAASEATGVTLVTEQLDRYSCEASNPPPRIRIVVPGITDELIAQIFTRKFSRLVGIVVTADAVVVQNDVIGMSEAFYINGMFLTLGTGLAQAEYDLVGVGS